MAFCISFLTICLLQVLWLNGGEEFPGIDLGRCSSVMQIKSTESITETRRMSRIGHIISYQIISYHIISHRLAHNFPFHPWYCCSYAKTSQCKSLMISQSRKVKMRRSLVVLEEHGGSVLQSDLLGLLSLCWSHLATRCYWYHGKVSWKWCSFSKALSG